MKQKRFFSVVLVFLLSLYSTVVLARPKVNVKVPSAPTGLVFGIVTDTSATLSWNSVSGASGYIVYRATPNDSSYTKIATISSTSYTSSGLNSSTKYWFYIQAYNSSGNSPDSTHISTTTKQTVVVPSKKVLGFTTYYYAGDSSSYNSMAVNSSYIDEIATHTYITDGLGNISGTVPANQVTYANSNGIKPYVMVSNNFSGSTAHDLLISSTNRQNLINNTLNALRTNNYKGVNVDFEGVFYYDRSYYTTFLSELYSSLHPQGYTVTVSVPAKTYDSTTNSWNGAFDYAKIALYSDEVILMTYDEHYPGGSAGPIASIGWVQNVVNYAVTVIPKEKLLLGVAAYGYDWSANGTKAYSINQIYTLASTNNAQILWDDASKSSYFNYADTSGIQHSVWFENSTSLAYKLDIVNNNGLSGIGIWRLGLENSDYWTTIKTKFNK